LNNPLTSSDTLGHISKKCRRGALPAGRHQGGTDPGREEIKVAARIRMIDDYSGHADGTEIARWIAARRPVGRGPLLVHGEQSTIKGLAERVAERIIIPAAKLFPRFRGV
jgi:predicted metal-dependent RNase